MNGKHCGPSAFSYAAGATTMVTYSWALITAGGPGAEAEDARLHLDGEGAGVAVRVVDCSVKTLGRAAGQGLGAIVGGTKVPSPR
ncbi:MAG: hypothetical protein LC799_32810 [Actinobacteria bacterium]|nr:hypothetical protein [Actinomycetota bacterium]